MNPRGAMVSNVMTEPTNIAAAPPRAEPADAALVAAFQAGDARAFDVIVRRHKDRVYRVLYRYLGNHEDALDIAQEVFIRAHRGLGAFAGRAQLATWLHSIAANLARNRLRDQGRKGRDQGQSLEGLLAAQPGAAQIAAVETATPRGAAQRAEVNVALEQCLAGLPEVYRMAFVLRLFDGLNYAEIAAVMEAPAGTVKSRLNQARKRLRACLEQHGILADHAGGP